VTVAGRTNPLPELFLVLATQNPIEQEGTYPLPEAQMDRFLFHVFIDYPSDADEVKILHLIRGEEAGTALSGEGKIPAQAVLSARAEVNRVTVGEALDGYFVALVAATRRPGEYEGDLKKWL
jgi:MoxR-like ATPase